MKKIFGVLICCLFYLTFIDLISAQSNYDFRLDNIENSKEYNKIIEFQDDILSDIYGIDLRYNEYSGPEIDFTKAVKTYNYTPEDLINNISNGTLLQNIRNNDDYSWKVPIGLREDGCDYAVVYKLPNNKFSYYTASTTKTGMKRVDYIFNQKQNFDLINGQDNEFNNIYALSISNMNMDLIVIDDKNIFSFIPFASRDDLLEIDNCKIYNSNEILEVINKYITSSSSRELFSGGSSSGVSKNNNMTYVVILILLIAIMIYILLKLKRRGSIK